jgi:hypothetical protein
MSVSFISHHRSLPAHNHEDTRLAVFVASIQASEQCPAPHLVTRAAPTSGERSRSYCCACLGSYAYRSATPLLHGCNSSET